ncbi:MAG: radical SAM protein [Gemmatimonadaceae bacterium]
MSSPAIDRRIRSLRPPKVKLDPYTAQKTLLEDERRPSGKREQTLTVFLSGAECPFTCSFCDLWQFTIDGPTPPGALTAQLANILGADKPFADRLKLYNASNFFDTRAVPQIDVVGIATLSRSFAALTVESHANTIGPATLEFAKKISPARLEVAVGLETIHPVAASQLNKRLDLARFDSSAKFLLDNGIDLRVFVLLGAPYVGADESIEWTVRTATHAVERGASIVSIIPVRGGNGELERLQALGHFTPPTLSQLEESLVQCLDLTNAVVTADLWDAESFAACEDCRSPRIERLRRMNSSGNTETRIACSTCGGA